MADCWRDSIRQNGDGEAVKGKDRFL
jgi:hypothetical protein